MQIVCKIAFFLALIGLTGCSPQKRLARLVAKHPELLTADTLRFKKNIVVPAKVVVLTIPADRFYKELKTADGVAVKDSVSGLSVKIAAAPVRSLFADTLTIHVEVPPDTIKIDEKIPVQKVVVQPQRRRWWWWVVAAGVVAAVVWLVRAGRRRD